MIYIVRNTVNCHKARELPKEQFKHEVEKHLTGKDTEPYEIVSFKLYKSQLPVVEQALETAGLMLGSDKSRGYCLEMICADLLAGANAQERSPEILLMFVARLYGLLAPAQKQAFAESLLKAPQMKPSPIRRVRNCPSALTSYTPESAIESETNISFPSTRLKRMERQSHIFSWRKKGESIEWTKGASAFY